MVYAGEMAKEKIVAAGFSLNGQLLATATFSETLDERSNIVRFQNVATLGAPLQQSNGSKLPISCADRSRANASLLSGQESELTIVAWGSAASVVVKLRSGTVSSGAPTARRVQPTS